MSTTGIATAALERARFRYANEAQLQQGLAQVFTDAGLAVRREVTLGVDGRIDFVLTHAISTHVVGVEVKVTGSNIVVARQLMRYATHVDDLLLVTTRTSHRALDGLELVGTDVRLQVFKIRGGGL